MRYPMLVISVLSVALFSIVACERAPDPDKYPITADSVLSDLPGETVTGLDGGGFIINGPLYAEGFNITYSGRNGEARLQLRTVNPDSRKGIDGEVVARYEFTGNAWKLKEIVADETSVMRPAYAKRLVELSDFPLHFAANIGDRPKVARELEKRAGVNAQDGVKQSTAVMFAAERGFLPIVKLLVEHGADVTIPNKFGYTALHASTNGKHLEIVKYLLANGADVGAKDDRGRTPLFFASESNSLALVRLHLEHGSDLDARDHNLWTPLYAAVNRGSLKVAEYLIEQGAQVTSETAEGSRSPLLSASFAGNVDMVKLLLEAGADVNARIGSSHSHSRGMTALQIAEKQGHQGVVELLKNAGAK